MRFGKFARFLFAFVGTFVALPTAVLVATILYSRPDYRSVNHWFGLASCLAAVAVCYRIAWTGKAGWFLSQRITLRGADSGEPPHAG